jgi:hypothetical protein
MSNTVLYENWVKNQKEEDQVFVFDNGILMVAFDRMLHFTLPDNMYLLLCIRPRRQGMYLTISSSQSGTAEAPSDKVLTDAPAQA